MDNSDGLSRIIFLIGGPQRMNCKHKECIRWGYEGKECIYEGYSYCLKLKPVEVGEPFRVDLKKMKEKQGWNMRKIWMHRAGLIWEHLLGTPVLIIINISMLLLIASLPYLYWKRVWDTMADRVFATVITDAGLLFFTGVVILPIYQDWFKPNLEKIKNNWNP